MTQRESYTEMEAARTRILELSTCTKIFLYPILIRIMLYAVGQ
jgi:hypothetical protein